MAVCCALLLAAAAQHRDEIALSVELPPWVQELKPHNSSESTWHHITRSMTRLPFSVLPHHDTRSSHYVIGVAFLLLKGLHINLGNPFWVTFRDFCFSRKMTVCGIKIFNEWPLVVQWKVKGYRNSSIWLGGLVMNTVLLLGKSPLLTLASYIWAYVVLYKASDGKFKSDGPKTKARKLLSTTRWPQFQRMHFPSKVGKHSRRQFLKTVVREENKVVLCVFQNFTLLSLWVLCNSPILCG